MVIQLTVRHRAIRRVLRADFKVAYYSDFFC